MLDSTLPGGALQSQKGKQHVPIRSMGSSRKHLPDAKNTTSHSYCVVLQGLWVMEHKKYVYDALFHDIYFSFFP